MSLKSQDDEQTGKKCALNSSGTKTPGAQMEEVQGPSTAVIQMTIQGGSSESHSVAAEPVGVDLDELPQALLDIVPTEVTPVRPVVTTSAYEYVAELEEPPMPAPVLGASRPAFSYRSQAALMHQQPAASAAVVHSAHTYDYTDEGELALEQALAAIVQANPAPQPTAAGVLNPAALDDPAAFYHELERGFNLVDIDPFEGGIQLQSDPPSVMEYSDNGAMIQSELFELGQGVFCADADAGPVEAVKEPASELDLPLPELPADSLSPNDQPGPSRPRAHAVQLYPGGGEGEPHTCYITHLPRLAIESTFFDEEEGEERRGGGGESLPLQARPLPSTSRNDDILRQLLGAPPDEEGEVPSAPAALQNTSEDSSEPDKENKPDTISVALRSTAISIASFGTDDSTIENAAALTVSRAAPDACLCPGDDNEINEPIPQIVAQAEVRDDEVLSLSEEHEVTSNRETEETQSEEIQSSGLVDSLTNVTDSYSMANTLSEEEVLKLGSENDNADSLTGDQEASTLSDDMEHLSVSGPLDAAQADTLADNQTTETEEAVPVTLIEDIQLGSVQEKEKVSTADDNVAVEEIAPIKESDHTSERPTTPTEEALASSEEVDLTSIASTQAGENVSVCMAQVEEEKPKQLVTASDGNEPAAVNVIPEEQDADTHPIANVDTVDTTASTAPKPSGSPKKRKVAAAGIAQIKSKKAKKIVSGANKKPVASGSTAAAAAAVVPAKQKRKNRQGSSRTASPLKAKVMQFLSTSESTDTSEDSNDSKTLAAIIAERNAAAAAVEGSTTASAGTAAAAATATGAVAIARTNTSATAASAAAHSVAIARADADATSVLAAPAMMPAQQTVSSQKAKGKRAASAPYAKPSKNQAKKARPAEAATTSMVLRSHRHM